MSRMLSKMNLISVVQQLPKEDIETIQGYVEMIEEENQKLKLQLSGTTFCYDEEEHRELKKQLENCYCNRTDCSSRIKDSKKYDSLVQKVETQQKEFIKYLEGKINKLKEQIKNYDIWHEVRTDINFLILKKQFYLEILQKYKEIIQTKNNNSV